MKLIWVRKESTGLEILELTERKENLLLTCCYLQYPYYFFAIEPDL